MSPFRTVTPSRMRSRPPSPMSTSSIMMTASNRSSKSSPVSARTKSLPISQPEVSGTPSRNRSESTAIPSPEEARTTGRLSRERHSPAVTRPRASSTETVSAGRSGCHSANRASSTSPRVGRLPSPENLALIKNLQS